MRPTATARPPGEEFRVAAAGPAVTLLLVLFPGWRRAAAATASSTPRRSTRVGLDLEVLIASWARERAAVRAQHDPGVPARRRPDRPRVRLGVSGNRHAATKISAYLGQGFAALMIVYGMYVMAVDATSGGLGTIVLGWMLGASARAAVAQSTFVDAPGGHHGGDIMDAEPVRSPRRSRRARLGGVLPALPGLAVVRGRRVRRALRRARSPRRGRARRGERRRRDARPRRVADAEQVRTDTPLESLLGSEPLRRLGALMAVDAQGRLRGVVTVEQLTRALRSRLA